MKHLVRFVQVFILTLLWGGAFAQAPIAHRRIPRAAHTVMG